METTGSQISSNSPGAGIFEGLSIEILRQFDQTSLSQLIDSWEINTFGKKWPVIRGLLMAGIKQSKSQSQKAETDNSNINTTSLSPFCKYLHSCWRPW